MNMKDALNYLSTLVKDKPWFYDLKALDPRRIVVYTVYQSGDILREIPDNINGYQVLVHFANKQKTKKDNPYIGSDISTDVRLKTQSEVTWEYRERSVYRVDLLQQELRTIFATCTPSISKLISELDRLGKICGVNALESIFYEIQDGKNAVTNISKQYPEVRKSLEELFDIYGFDAIYEQIER